MLPSAPRIPRHCCPGGRSTSQCAPALPRIRKSRLQCPTARDSPGNRHPHRPLIRASLLYVADFEPLSVSGSLSSLPSFAPENFPFLQDAPILQLSQDDYLIPFHHFAVYFALVQASVKNPGELAVAVHNFLYSSHLHSRLCTASPTLTAPIVCVDFSRYSGNFACVDGRKGWHNKMSRSKVD